MEKDKSRGLKHIRDKRKYKGNSVKDPKHVPAKLKQNLDSNWFRYEKDDDAQGFQLTSSTDFSLLASAPITQGHHFQFKSDKIIAEDVENKTTDDLFSLDLNLLKCSILTIPFYHRVGIEETIFVENQINFMKKNAEDSLLKYNKKYSTKEVIQDHKEPTCSTNDRHKNENIDDVTTREEERDKDNCIIPEADDILEVVDKMKELGKTEITEKKFDEDLEQWLDEILDD